ncbi:MAG: hypothetical protein ABFD83_04370 [Armatimonadota bacterium]
MTRFIAVIAVLVCLNGCGGSGSDSSDSNRSNEITVSSTRSSPVDISVDKGNRVIWTNDTSSSIKIVSGTLEQVSKPVVRDDISCLSDGTFSPDSMDADLGDKIVWRNLSSKDAIAVEILNASGKVIKSLPIEPSMTASFNAFPRAGKYTYRVAGSTKSGSLLLYGVPTPDGNFESIYLANGRQYSTLLFQPGVQNYYIVQQNSTGRSCVTAKITVL